MEACSTYDAKHGRLAMGLLELAIVAFLISLVAGAFGFTGIAEGAETIAKVLFGIFLALAILLLILVVLGVSIVT